MTAFLSLAVAVLKGYLRDRQAVFFSIFFPLMFLVLFGGIFNGSAQSKVDVVEIGRVPLIDSLPKQADVAFHRAFTVNKTDNRARALNEVKDGDTTLALEQVGNRIIAHYSGADPVQAATAQGAIQSFVQGANLAATGKPPTYRYVSQRVEDKSLGTIEYMTPSLLGWAVATSATFGAAATLTGWRNTRLLRRLRLAPVSTQTIVAARVGVTILIALGQMAIFLILGTAFFGLQLSGSWWLSIPLLVCGTLSFMALGLLAGALAKTVEGASSLANIFVLPMAFLSGSFFRLQGAPNWLNVVSNLLPLRHLNDGMLDVMVRGEGVSAIWSPILILVGFAALALLVASRFFNWETD